MAVAILADRLGIRAAVHRGLLAASALSPPLAAPEPTKDTRPTPRPKRCARCQVPLQGEDGQPQRHQVTDIPAVKPRVTEYQLHCLVCIV
jgi:hypothetical protein